MLLELTPYERTMLSLLGAVSTLHHFKGNVNEAFLRTRITEILQANTYLGGRLQWSSANHTVMLEVPNCVDRIDWHFKLHKSEHNPFHSLSCGDIRTTFARYLVKSGFECVNKRDETGILYRITLFTYPEGFSILHSLSHVVGDGKTFYRLMGMLSELDGKVTSLNPQRLPNFQTSVDTVIGRAMTDCMNSWSLATGYLLNFVFAPKTFTHVFRLKASFLQDQKASFRYYHDLNVPGDPDAAVSYISTNDILMHVLAHDIFQSDFASLTLSLRDRIREGDDDSDRLPHRSEYESINDRAGNLIFPIVLTREELYTPSTVRARIHTLSGCKAAPSSPCSSPSSSLSSYLPSLPSVWQQLWMQGVYFSSNWAGTGFHEPVRFAQATSLYHFPLTMGGGSNGVHAVIMFQLQDDTHSPAAQQGDVGLVVTTNAACLAKIRAHHMVAEELL